MIPGITAQSISGTPITTDEAVGTGAGVGAALGVGFDAATGNTVGTANGTGAATGSTAAFSNTVGTAVGNGTATATGTAVVALATFDGTATNVTLSNGNLTATHSNTTGNSGARSTATKTAGKYYFEITAVATHGAFDCVGALVSTGSYTDMVTNATNCLACYKNSGNIYANNVNSTLSIGPFITTDILCIAIDLGARRAWVRRNGGFWNNNATYDPATNTGGVTLASTVAYAPAVGFGGTGTATNDAFTGNFGQNAYTYTVPSGFGNWPV